MYRTALPFSDVDWGGLVDGHTFPSVAVWRFSMANIVAAAGFWMVALLHAYSALAFAGWISIPKPPPLSLSSTNILVPLH